MGGQMAGGGPLGGCEHACVSRSPWKNTAEYTCAKKVTFRRRVFLHHEVIN